MSWVPASMMDEGRSNLYISGIVASWGVIDDDWGAPRLDPGRAAAATKPVTPSMYKL